MAITGRTVIGVFDESANADRAIDALQNAGFSSSQIHHSGRGAAGSGGFFEGVKNFFTGNDTASSGHVADDLTGMGVSDDEASYYENEYKNGRTVVSVNAGDRAEEAKTILDSSGAYNYANQRGTSAGYTSAATTTGTAYNNTNTSNTDYADTTTGYDRTRDANYTNTNDANYTDTTDVQRPMRLREEQLNVSKQQVQSGEVSLGKNIVEEQKTVNVPVTHEEVYVENRPVSGDIADDNTPIGEGENIRVPVTEERVNVNKNTVTTGEVSVGKRAVQENQQVSDTVRREEARLDQSGNPIVQNNTLNNDNTTDTRNSY